MVVEEEADVEAVEQQLAHVVNVAQQPTTLKIVNLDNQENQDHLANPVKLAITTTPSNKVRTVPDAAVTTSNLKSTEARTNMSLALEEPRK